MPRLEGFRVQNYRILKDVTLGRLWNTQRREPLTPLVAVIGKNGTGKSTLFDAFSFLKDALEAGVEEACERKQRGGFFRIRSAGQPGPIRFETYYRETPADRPITYELEIATDEKGRPYVSQERLRQRRQLQRTGRPYSFLWLGSGEGSAWVGGELANTEDPSSPEEDPASIPVRLTDRRRLGISTLGHLREHPRIERFRNFLEGWYLSYFSPDSARSMPLAGPQKHLSMHGDNIGNVVQYLEREYPDRFQSILKRIAQRIPGVRSIDTKRAEDGRLLLRFNDNAFRDPFFAQQVSDGTLKMFAYLLLLEDPDPPPFVCIEEPENGLYHKLLESLAHELRDHAAASSKASQVFVTTHQPYFVNALEPKEVWVLEKRSDGFADIRRADEDKTVAGLVSEGLPLGGLWYSNYLDAS